MSIHLRRHTFTGDTDHDFTGLSNNYLPKLNSVGTGITNSIIYDNGTNVGVGTTSPPQRFSISGGNMNVELGFAYYVNNVSIFGTEYGEGSGK
jgi:hypothetical protein